MKFKDVRRMLKQKNYKEVMNKIEKKEGICSNCFDANNHTESRFYYGEKLIQTDLSVV